MSKMGYQLEREIELWSCKLLGQDPKADFFKRSYRTATSGAKGDGDVRVRSELMPFLVLVECKHHRRTYKGEAAFRLDEAVLKQVIEESVQSKEPHQDFSVPTVCFAFKGMMQDRLWFIFRRAEFEKLRDMHKLEMLPLGANSLLQPIEYKKTEKHSYLMIRRSDLLTGGISYSTANFPGYGELVFTPPFFLESILRGYSKTKT